MRFKDKIAIVTGGASGIGAATAALLASEGAKVVLADVKEPAKDAPVEFHACDVTSYDALKGLIDGTVARHGRVDLLFNNAGIGVLAESPELEAELWDKVFAVNVSAIFYACKAAIPHMRLAGGGAIVNTASISGLAGDYGMTAYNASKGAVVNYTKALAIDHARDNIRINALCPGLITHTGLTSMIPDEAAEQWAEGIPMGRPGSAREMATVVAFLLSDDASYMTGSIVVADGGVMAHTGQPNAMARRRQANAGR
jgi:meso-butanediol dehydrogenase/(S,S)-butanediol dehydrogenase/diacetyl reductase